MQPLISVIIPVYNSDIYLPQCLDSVIYQSYENLQIICVDDSSSDKSWDILQAYAARDSRIQIYQKENEGVSLARNYGLGKADGVYLLFVDSDDWIEPDTCAVAVKAAECSTADVVMWSYLREYGEESRPKNIFSEDIVLNADDIYEMLYRRMVGAYGTELRCPENADALCTVWGKLYRRSLIEEYTILFHDIREIGTYEDGLFNLNVFSYAQSAVYLNNFFYHYRRNNDHSISTAYDPERPKKWDCLFDLIEAHIRKHELDETFDKALKNRIALSLIALGINEIESNASANLKIRRIRAIISSERYQKAVSELEKNMLSIPWKIFFTFAEWNCAEGVYLLLLVIQKIRGR